MAINKSSANVYKIREFLSILDDNKDSWKLRIYCMFNFMSENRPKFIQFLNSLFFPPENLPRYSSSLFYIDDIGETILSSADNSMDILSDFIKKPTLENYKILSEAAGPFESVLRAALYDKIYNKSETLILECIEQMYHVKFDMLKKYLFQTLKSKSKFEADIQLLYYLFNPEACFYKIPIISSIFCTYDIQQNSSDLCVSPIISPNSEYQFHINGNIIKNFHIYINDDKYICIDNISCNLYIQPKKPLHSYIIKTYLANKHFYISDIYSIRINKSDEDQNLLKKNFHRRRKYGKHFFHQCHLSLYKIIDSKSKCWDSKTILWPYLLCYENIHNYNWWKMPTLIIRPNYLKIFIVAITEELGSIRFGILVTLEHDPKTLLSYVKFTDLSNKIATRILFSDKLNEYENEKIKRSIHNPELITINTHTKFLKKYICAIANIIPNKSSTKQKSNKIFLDITTII